MLRSYEEKIDPSGRIQTFHYYLLLLDEVFQLLLITCSCDNRFLDFSVDEF